MEYTDLLTAANLCSAGVYQIRWYPLNYSTITPILLLLRHPLSIKLLLFLTLGFGIISSFWTKLLLPASIRFRSTAKPLGWRIYHHTPTVLSLTAERSNITLDGNVKFFLVSRGKILCSLHVCCCLWHEVSRIKAKANEQCVIQNSFPSLSHLLDCLSDGSQHYVLVMAKRMCIEDCVVSGLLRGRRSWYKAKMFG